MPEIFDPSPHRKRRSSIGESGLKGSRRRRRRNFPSFSKKKECSLSQEFNFDSDTPDVPPRPTLLLKSCNTKMKLSPSKVKSSSTNKSSPLPKLPSPRILESQYTMPQENSSIPSQSYQSEKSRTLSHFRHAFLVDTRAIDTPKGRSMGEFFINQTLFFLSSMRQRGMFPQMVVFLELSSSFSPSAHRMRAPMMAKTYHTQEFPKTAEEVNDLYAPLWIKPAANSSNRKNTSTGLQVPTRFLANASWKAFGDLVEETTKQDQCYPLSTRQIPLSITLLTNNISLFLDGDIQIAHRPAVTNFWSRIRPLFQRNLLRSIEIAIVVTGCIRQQEKATVSTLKSIYNDEQYNEKLQDSDVAIGSSVQVLQKVKALEIYLTELTDADIRTYGTGYQAVSPVTIAITVLENFPAASYELGWRWLSQILSPPDFSRASIKFDLPETRDGSQCSISLDLQYRIFPYPANSEAAAGLLADLQHLTTCCIKVVQLVPISCIDANLLFGVPVRASPSFQDDEDQYKEMKTLVLALFQQLRERDVALMLVAIESKGLPVTQRVPLHQTTHQIYLLMGQYSGEESINEGSLDASLFRYANADQMMSNRCTDTSSPCMLNVDAFKEYVEKALDEIPNGLVNPFLNHELYDPQNNIPNDQESDKKLSAKLDFWTDESGVGSLVQPDVERKMDEMLNRGISNSLSEKELNRSISNDDDEKGHDESSSVSLPTKVTMNTGSQKSIDTRTADSYGTVCEHDQKADIVHDSKDHRTKMDGIEEMLLSSRIEVNNMIKVPSSIYDCNSLSESFTISRESLKDAKPYRPFTSSNSICLFEGQNRMLSSDNNVSKADALRSNHVIEAIKDSTQGSTKEWDENDKKMLGFHLSSDMEGVRHTFKFEEAPKATTLALRFPDSSIKICERNIQSNLQKELLDSSDHDPFHSVDMYRRLSSLEKDNKNGSSENQLLTIEKGALVPKLNKERNYDSDSEWEGQQSSEGKKGINMTVLSHTMTEAQKTAFGRSLSSDDSETGNRNTILKSRNGICKSIDKVKVNQTIESPSSSDDEIYTSNTRKNPIAFLKSLIDSESDEG